MEVTYKSHGKDESHMISHMNLVLYSATYADNVVPKIHVVRTHTGEVGGGGREGEGEGESMNCLTGIYLSA